MWYQNNKIKRVEQASHGGNHILSCSDNESGRGFFARSSAANVFGFSCDKRGKSQLGTDFLKNEKCVSYLLIANFNLLNIYFLIFESIYIPIQHPMYSLWWKTNKHDSW